MISETGHTDLLVVTDAGLPIPSGSERIDLAYRPGAPAFLDVLDTVLAELVRGGGDGLGRGRREEPGGAGRAAGAVRPGWGFEIELLPHVEFKKLSHGARAFVRSGEFTPYANVILHAGVAY